MCSFPRRWPVCRRARSSAAQDVYQCQAKPYAPHRLWHPGQPAGVLQMSASSTVIWLLKPPAMERGTTGPAGVQVRCMWLWCGDTGAWSRRHRLGCKSLTDGRCVCFCVASCRVVVWAFPAGWAGCGCAILGRSLIHLLRCRRTSAFRVVFAA